MVEVTIKTDKTAEEITQTTNTWVEEAKTETDPDAAPSLGGLSVAEVKAVEAVTIPAPTNPPATTTTAPTTTTPSTVGGPAGWIGFGSEPATALLRKKQSYTGDLDAKGYVIVSDGDFGALDYSVIVAGLENNYDYALHIHSGDNCQNPGGLLGSGGGAAVTSDAQGRVMQRISKNIGFDVESTRGKPFVLHDTDGQQMLCGILDAPATDCPPPQVETTTPEPEEPEEPEDPAYSYAQCVSTCRHPQGLFKAMAGCATWPTACKEFRSAILGR